MKESTNELARFISSLNLGSDEIPIDLHLATDKVVDAKYNVAELVDLAWDREVQLDLDCHEDTMEGIDVDDQPKPLITKICEYV